MRRFSVLFLGMTILVAPFPATAENVPDALSVEWQGQKPCEKLFEDAQLQDEKGTRQVELSTGSHGDVPPVPWHELTNIGDTTLQFLIIEKKYQAGPP